MLNKNKFQIYLHENIPLSAAMQCHIEVLETDKVVISAPLEPNINHRETVFGGSASTLATLAAWTLVHTRLSEAGVQARVVIQQHCMSYNKPITDRFKAICELLEHANWDRFTKILQRRGKGRIHLSAVLECQQDIVGRFEGDFVGIMVGV